MALFAMLTGSLGTATPLSEGNDRNDGERLWAYGDSIVSARDDAGSGLAPNGADSFINWYRALYAPYLDADHSLSGYGQGCLWAKSHFSSMIPSSPRNQNVVLAFGNNDPAPARGNMTPEQSASCNADLYNMTLARRTTVVWANISPITADCTLDPGYDISLPAQQARANATQHAADAMGVRLWNRYDAIDIHPHNGVLDPADPSYLYDCIHPNRAGYIALAQSLNAWVNGGES